jgi:O-antigen ligase
MEYALVRTNTDRLLIALAMAAAVACALAPQYALVIIGAIVTLTGGLIAVYLLVRNPYWAYLTFAFSLPFATLKLTPVHGMSNPAFMALALLSLSVVVSMHRLPSLHYGKLGVKPWLLGIFAAVGLLRAPFTIDQPEAVRWTLMAFVIVFAYFAGALLIDTPQKLRTCLNWFLAGTAVSAVTVIFNYFLVAGPAKAFYRAGGLYADAASGTVICFLLAIPLALELLGGRESWLARLCYAFVVMGSIAVIIFSATRSAWLALAVLFLIELIRHPLRALAGAALTLLLLAGMVRIYLPEVYKAFGFRVFVAIHPEYGRSTETIFRIENYRVAANMLAAYPLIGVGLGNFAAHAGQFGRETVPLELNLVAHNAFLETLTGAGLLGGLPYIFVWLLTLWELAYASKRAPPEIRRLSIALAIGFALYIIHSMFHGSTDIVLLLGFVFSLGTIVSRLSVYRQQPKERAA